MNLTVAALCDAATVREGLLHILGAGPTRIARPSYPAPLGTSVALQFLASPSDLEKEHDLVVSVNGRVGDLARLTVKMGNGQILDEADPDDHLTVPFVLPLQNVLIPEPGFYEVRISLDGKKAVVLPFRAALVEGPQAQPKAKKASAGGPKRSAKKATARGR